MRSEKDLLYAQNSITTNMKKFSLCALFALWGILSHAATIYVDNGIPFIPSNNGVAWSKAFQKLEDAISAANNGDIIRVATGTYTAPNSNGYVLKNGVKIYGGHPPAFTNPIPDYLRNALRNPNTHPVRLISTSGTVFSANSNINNYTIVDGFTIGNQHCDGLTLTNHPTHYTYHFSAKFVNCDFKVNRFGIHIDSPIGKISPQFIDCEFSLSGSPGNYSAAVYIENHAAAFLTPPSVAPSFKGCEFHGFDNGVSLIAQFGLYSPYFEKCSFHNIWEHVFTNGRAQYNTGIGFLHNSPPHTCPAPTEFLYTPKIENSIFYNNGGIMDMTAHFRCNSTDIATKFTNCTFFNNPGFIKPAFSMNNFSNIAQTQNTPDMVVLQLENCISHGNIQANGKLMELGPALAVTIRNSMIEASTTHSNGTTIDPAYTGFSLHPTIHHITDLGGNIFNQNPQFVNTSPSALNLDLQASSPARNSGFTPLVPFPGSTVATDYIGRVRVNENVIDMGAYEYCAHINSCHATAPIALSKSSNSVTEEEITVDIYPNPFTSTLRIQRSTDAPANVILLDMKGQEVFNTSFESYEKTLNLGQVANGMYTLIINDGTSKTLRKVVKK